MIATMKPLENTEASESSEAPGTDNEGEAAAADLTATGGN